jgi:hypothetical protein
MSSRTIKLASGGFLGKGLGGLCTRFATTHDSIFKALDVGVEGGEGSAGPEAPAWVGQRVGIAC